MTSQNQAHRTANEVYRELSQAYGIDENDHAAITKRALAIALTAAQMADEDGNIHFLKQDENGQTVEVMVPQRFERPTAVILPFRPR